MPSTQPHATPPNVVRSHRYLARDVLLAMVSLGMVACSGLVAAPHAVAAESAIPAQTAVQPGDVVLLDFSASWCGPCRAMAPVVQGIEQAGWPVRHIDVDQEHDLVRRFGVSGVPCYILLVKGHQVGRIDGATTQRELEGLLAKGLQTGRPQTPLPPTSEAAGSVAGIPLATTVATEALPTQTPPQRHARDAAILTATQPARAPVGPTALAALEESPAPAQLAAPATMPAVTDQAMVQSQLLAATARLQVQDPEGSSRGTGTVIDCRQGEALILTCAHIFRDSGGEGRIAVDLFGSDETRGLAGQLVAWDLDRDVALVSVFTDAEITPARVAGPERELAVGEHVASVGCDGGADPTVHFSQITAVDKYLGPPNVQVAGQPVPGRSGGGLFDLNGSLIGVCNAADPADQEGLYAALQAVHEQLDDAGLSFVYRTTYPSGGPTPLADTAPAMPESMPSVAFDRRDRTAAVPTASVADAAPAGGASAGTGRTLLPGELALLEQVRQHRGQAEVICIVRPHGGEGSSEVFVLSAAGEDFVDHLSAAHNGHPQLPAAVAPSQAPPASQVRMATAPQAGGR